MNRARLSPVSQLRAHAPRSLAPTNVRARAWLVAVGKAFGLVVASSSRAALARVRLACLLLASASLVGCAPEPKPDHRLVGTWEFSAERTRALSRDEREQFESPEFGAMKLRFGADGYFAFEGQGLSKGVPQASRYELARETGDLVTILVTRPDKPDPETMQFEFFGADELRLQGERRLAFQRVR